MDSRWEATDMSTITLKDAIKTLSSIGISLSKQDGEYRVAAKGTRRDDTFSGAYFTSDINDAVATGRAIALNLVPAHEVITDKADAKAVAAVDVPALTLDAFVAALNTRFNVITDHIGYQFSVERPGLKYTRIVQATRYADGRTAGRSVFCFVDHAGNILKAAGWKAPAKGVRATLATVDISKVDPYGSWLYAR